MSEIRYKTSKKARFSKAFINAIVVLSNKYNAKSNGVHSVVCGTCTTYVFEKSRFQVFAIDVTGCTRFPNRLCSILCCHVVALSRGHMGVWVSVCVYICMCVKT